MSEDRIKARQFRRLLVNSTVAFIFVALFVFFATAARELLLPIILGVFLGYLFRPMVAGIKGSPMARMLKGCLMLVVLVSGIYWTTKAVRASLPNEKEKLELLVRLKYRLNLRYSEWMGLKENESKGNWAYNLLGKELDPLIGQVNQFLALDEDQRQLFQLYSQGHNELPPINEKYYQYYLANIRLMNQAEVKVDNGANAPAPATPKGSQDRAPGEGLAHLMKLVSVWLVFPLVFVFILLDKGQILQFFLRLVPNRYFELSRTIADEVDQALGHYIRGTMMECFLVGLTISIGLWFCGFAPNVFILVGLIGGLTNAIPFVGPALALAVGSGFALIAENINPLLPFINLENVFVAVLVVVALAQLLDNAVYQPLVVGGAVNIHPLVVILSVFGGSLTFGFAGLLLAIPTVVIVKVVTETLFLELKAYKII